MIDSHAHLHSDIFVSNFNSLIERCLRNKIHHILIPATKPLDYVIDAIDSFSLKSALLEIAYHQGYKIVSSMGAGEKLDPSQIKIDDLLNTSVCPLAARVRKKLRRLGLRKGITAVYSTEPPLNPHPPKSAVEFGRRRSINGTVSYLPAIFGLFLVSVIFNDMIKQHKLLPNSNH